MSGHEVPLHAERPTAGTLLPRLAVCDVMALESFVSTYFLSPHAPLDLAKFIHMSLPANVARPLMRSRYLLGRGALG